MYSETIRLIDERDSKKLQEQSATLKADVRGTAKLYFGCLGIMLPITVLIWYLNRDSLDQPATAICGYVIVCAILGAAMFDGADKKKKRMKASQERSKGGTALERRIVSTRCFAIVPTDFDEGSDDQPVFDNEGLVYFDIGDQGTVIIDAPGYSAKGFPSSDMTFVELRDAKGIAIETTVECNGESLTPLATFSREELEETPGFESFANAESFTVLPDPFDVLLKQISAD